MNIIIRPETTNDIEAIRQVTHDAFSGRPYSDGTEPFIIERLRKANSLAMSLVAELDGKIVGHVAFSLVTINKEYKDWYGLGPISVQSGLQKQGIGSKLIHEGLALLRERGARGCVLEGSPDYYHRFGFKDHPDLIYEKSPAPEYFMVLPFYEDIPKGTVEFHKAFYSEV
jgi:putative acetyltransferase